MQKRPSFWDPRNIRNPDYRPGFQRARDEGRAAKLLKVPTQLRRQVDRHLLVAIDYENDFGDYGRLPVKGTYDDLERFGERLIKGVLEEHYTDFIFTIDTHPAIVIHGDGWWVDQFGNPPDVSVPMWMELLDDKKAAFNGKWVDGRQSRLFFPRVMKEHTVGYAKHLQTTEQGNIWVFTTHCREGTDGIGLNPAIAELLEWASAARDIEPIYMRKGMVARVDWFGPFWPCMPVPELPDDGRQLEQLNLIGQCTTVEIAGEAEDFCVNAGVLQILEYHDDPAVHGRLRFLSDCTSAIVPGSDVVKNLHARMRESGVNIITHDAPFS